MLRIKSVKREYQIALKESTFKRVLSELGGKDNRALQNYIDSCFSMSRKLGSSQKPNAWSEASVWKDKAKMAICIKEGLVSFG